MKRDKEFFWEGWLIGAVDFGSGGGCYGFGIVLGDLWVYKVGDKGIKEM